MIGIANNGHDEAIELKQRFFPDDDPVEFRHYPDCRNNFLQWQCGVNEPEKVQCNGSSREVERYHLLIFAPTKDRLIALLDSSDGVLPS